MRPSLSVPSRKEGHLHGSCKRHAAWIALSTRGCCHMTRGDALIGRSSTPQLRSQLPTSRRPFHPTSPQVASTAHFLSVMELFTKVYHLNVIKARAVLQPQQLQRHSSRALDLALDL